MWMGDWRWPLPHSWYSGCRRPQACGPPEPLYDQGGGGPGGGRRRGAGGSACRRRGGRDGAQRRHLVLGHGLGLARRRGGRGPRRGRRRGGRGGHAQGAALPHVHGEAGRRRRGRRRALAGPGGRCGRCRRIGALPVGPLDRLAQLLRHAFVAGRRLLRVRRHAHGRQRAAQQQRGKGRTVERQGDGHRRRWHTGHPLLYRRGWLRLERANVQMAPTGRPGAGL